MEETRSEEVAQTKVESSQKFPLRVPGMALFNTFLNSHQAAGADYPVIAAPNRGRARRSHLSARP